MDDYKEHILKSLRRRKKSGLHDTGVACPECSTELERDGFSTNCGGGLWSTSVYCRGCGWMGPFLYIRDSEEYKTSRMTHVVDLPYKKEKE